MAIPAESTITQLTDAMPMMNPWERKALDFNFPEEDPAAAAAFGIPTSSVALPLKDSVHDPIIYPGIYSSTGFDLLNILFQVISRPSPLIDLGPVDASCAIIMCDLQLPDCPVVYASEAFSLMTGYSQMELLGRNCRFLQAPGGKVGRRSTRQHVEKALIKKMRKAVESNEELAVEVINFRKDGTPFINLLAMIPVCWNSTTPRYSVGFAAEKTW